MIRAAAIHALNIAGIAAVSIGAYLAAPPLGWVTAGAGALALAWLIDNDRGGDNRRE